MAGMVLASTVVIASAPAACPICDVRRDRLRRSPAAGARLAPWAGWLGMDRSQRNTRLRPSLASAAGEALRA